MKKRRYILLFIVILFECTRCSNKEKSVGVIQANCGTPAALAGCLVPKFSPEYYVDQGVKYFQTMQSDIPNNVIPNYADLVIRWEWPPWLLLTGYTKSGLISSDILLKQNPTSYYKINCRAFETQPFCRCHVIFNYNGDSCPIYEEFTFNNQGEVTFIEAWSDYESRLPMNAGADHTWDEQEYWGMKDVNRLSAKVPGLGNDSGRIDPNADYMKEAAIADKDVAELLRRIKDPISTYLEQLITHQDELKHGCEVPPGDTFPYYHP